MSLYTPEKATRFFSKQTDHHAIINFFYITLSHILESLQSIFNYFIFRERESERATDVYHVRIYYHFNVSKTMQYFYTLIVYYIWWKISKTLVRGNHILFLILETSLIYLHIVIKIANGWMKKESTRNVYFSDNCCMRLIHVLDVQ